MKAAERSFWKNCTANSIHDLDTKKEEIVEFFLEEPGFIAIYISDGTLRWPARTVSLENPAHYKKVLGSWAARGKVVDHREDKTLVLFD